MKDTDFEKDSRAHSFWSEWQGAADRAGGVDTYLDDLIAKAAPQWQGVDPDEFMDMVRGREPETFSEAVAGISPDWGCVVNGGGVSLPGEIYSGRGVLFTFDTGARCSHTGNLIIDLT